MASFDVGPRGELRTSALMGYLEDAAGAHAAAFGVGVRELQPRGFAWVLSRYHLRLLRVPLLGESLEVSTWPSGRTAVFATRDFEVRDAGGSVVALATTSWAVIDLASKRPRRVSDVVSPELVVERRAIADDFRSLPSVE
ncbi:MAG TPA: acyl-ACP thioesterase domain-containing protein, partial [Longimicrobiales bacterium]